MGSVASINYYKDVCCPKDRKLLDVKFKDNYSYNEENDNKIILNASINNSIENLNNKKNKNFFFENNDDYNIYNKDAKIEAHEYENSNLEPISIYENHFKNESELINDENNVRESGANSFNFSFQYFLKNSNNNNNNKLKLNDHSHKLKTIKYKETSNINNKENINDYNYFIPKIIKIQRFYRKHIGGIIISEKKTCFKEENKKDKEKNQVNKINIHLGIKNIEYSKNYSSLLLNRYLTEFNFVDVKEESFRSVTIKSNKLQELEPPQFCTLRDLDNDKIKGYFLLKKKMFLYQGKKDKEGKKIGFGLISWEDSSKLKGYFNDSKVNGIVYFYNCGSENSTFFGEYNNNIPNGYGIYSRKGYSLEGNKWNKNNLNGVGIAIWEEGEMYEGDYKNNTKDGIGLYRWADGCSYIGEFKKNKINGFGKMNFANGNLYEGEFIDGFLSGWGKFIWDDGKYYIGNYSKDKKHGFGIFVWSLEPLMALIGFWNQGKQSGLCIKLYKGNCKIVFANESKTNIEINSRYEISKYLLPSQSKYKNFFKKKYNEYERFINFASK